MSVAPSVAPNLLSHFIVCHQSAQSALAQVFFLMLQSQKHQVSAAEKKMTVLVANKLTRYIEQEEIVEQLLLPLNDFKLYRL